MDLQICNDKNQEQINKVIDGYVKEFRIESEFNKFSGSILALKGEETIINTGFGFADELNKINNNSDTMFLIGSISKMFTAVAIMKLYEEKKLDINDSAAKYLNIKGLEDDIKIVNLLNHTSGLKNYVMCNKRFDFYNENNPLTIAKDMISMKRNFNAGKKFSYSNTGYLILALIIENITKIKFEDYMEDNILNPLDMKDSEFISRSSKKRATGYKKGKVENIFHHSAFFGCGDIISTTGDLKKFILGFNKGEIIRRDLVELMQKLSAKNKLMKYGYGCMISELEGGKRFGHGGSIPNSFSSQIAHYTESDITIVVLCNDIRSIKRFIPGALVAQYMERCIYEKLTLKKLTYMNKIVF
ncbi:MAG: serine hydrolase domain-containing protein [Clostridium sp.]